MTDDVQTAEQTTIPPTRRPSRPRRRLRIRPTPTLRFTPTAWAKLLFLRDAGDTEVGGFGITAAKDQLLVTDLHLVRQATTRISVQFADDAVAGFFDEQVDAGLKPEQFARIWVHTHPGNSPHPSSVDEETFDRVFGRSEWAVMFILAQGGDTSARLRFNVGPGCDLLIPVVVDYSQPFAGSDEAIWTAEYRRNVVSVELLTNLPAPARGQQSATTTPFDQRELVPNVWEEFVDEFDERFLADDVATLW